MPRACSYFLHAFMCLLLNLVPSIKSLQSSSFNQVTSIKFLQSSHFNQVLSIKSLQSSSFNQVTSIKFNQSINLVKHISILSKTLLTLERIAMQHRGNGVAGRMCYFIIRACECTLPALMHSCQTYQSEIDFNQARWKTSIRLLQSSLKFLIKSLITMVGGWAGGLGMRLLRACADCFACMCRFLTCVCLFYSHAHS